MEKSGHASFICICFPFVLLKLAPQRNGYTELTNMIVEWKGNLKKCRIGLSNKDNDDNDDNNYNNNTVSHFV